MTEEEYLMGHMFDFQEEDEEELAEDDEDVGKDEDMTGATPGDR